MTLDATVDVELAEPVVDATVSHVPGTCAIHGLELVDARRLGLRRYGAQRPVTCPELLEHTDLDRDRCRWCGGVLVPPGTPYWSVSETKEYCSSADRLRAFRAKRRADPSVVSAGRA